MSDTEKITTIQLTERTRAKLEAMKIVPRETFNEVIERLLAQWERSPK